MLSPSMLVSHAMAQDSNLFVAAWTNLGPTFFIVFLLLIIAGITLIIFNSIAVRRKAFIKDDVINPIMESVKGLDIEGAKGLCDQYKLPVTSIIRGGLERIQDDELDIEAIEKGLDENAALHMSKPFTWINMLNTVGSIAPMIGLITSSLINAFLLTAIELKMIKVIPAMMSSKKTIKKVAPKFSHAATKRLLSCAIAWLTNMLGESVA